MVMSIKQCPESSTCMPEYKNLTMIHGSASTYYHNMISNHNCVAIIIIESVFKMTNMLPILVGLDCHAPG